MVESRYESGGLVDNERPCGPNQMKSCNLRVDVAGEAASGERCHDGKTTCAESGTGALKKLTIPITVSTRGERRGSGIEPRAKPGMAACIVDQA
jgi:hypothetical protein